MFVSSGDSAKGGCSRIKFRGEETKISSSPVIMDGNKQILDSDGNRVNVGNFDQNGFNVNNNWDDNRNDNLGLASSRTSICQQRIFLKRFFVYFNKI